MKKSVYVLDTTALIDLYEAGHIDGVLGVTEARFVVTTNVWKELDYFDRPTGERVEVSPAEKERLRTTYGIDCLQFTDGADESADYNHLRTRLGPGESEAATIAASRGHTLVSDDGPARRKIRAHFAARRPDPDIIGLKEMVQRFEQNKWLSKTICDAVVSFMDGKEKRRKGG